MANLSAENDQANWDVAACLRNLLLPLSLRRRCSPVNPCVPCSSTLQLWPGLAKGKSRKTKVCEVDNSPGCSLHTSVTARALRLCALRGMLCAGYLDACISPILASPRLKLVQIGGELGSDRGKHFVKVAVEGAELWVLRTLAQHAAAPVPAGAAAPVPAAGEVPAAASPRAAKAAARAAAAGGGSGHVVLGNTSEAPRWRAATAEFLEKHLLRCHVSVGWEGPQQFYEGRIIGEAAFGQHAAKPCRLRCLKMQGWQPRLAADCFPLAPPLPVHDASLLQTTAARGALLWPCDRASAVSAGPSSCPLISQPASQLVCMCRAPLLRHMRGL